MGLPPRTVTRQALAHGACLAVPLHVWLLHADASIARRLLGAFLPIAFGIPDCRTAIDASGEWRLRGRVAGPTTRTHAEASLAQLSSVVAAGHGITPADIDSVPKYFPLLLKVCSTRVAPSEFQATAVSHHRGGFESTPGFFTPGLKVNRLHAAHTHCCHRAHRANLHNGSLEQFASTACSARSNTTTGAGGRAAR